MNILNVKVRRTTMASLRDWFYWIYDNDVVTLESITKLAYPPITNSDKLVVFNECRWRPILQQVMNNLYVLYLTNKRPESAILLSGWQNATVNAEFITHTFVSNYESLIEGNISGSGCLGAIKFTKGPANCTIRKWALRTFTDDFDLPNVFTIDRNQYYALQMFDNRQEITLLELRQVITVDMGVSFHLVYHV